MIKEIVANGLGFIGDPHVWSKQPGRRLDICFRQTVIDSLQECVDYCNSKNIVPLILGDLLHDNNESDWLVFNSLLRVFKSSKNPVWIVVGNHEKTQSVLTDDTMLSGLREAGVINCIEASGVSFVLRVEEQRFLVGGSAYGFSFPKSVKEELEKFSCEYAIWVSHHDLAFDGIYPAPSVLPIEEIKGAGLLINGHMHKTLPSKQVGDMVAYNPGNITPLSIDAKDHKPAIWHWNPGFNKKIVAHYLKHDPNCIDLSGTLVDGEGVNEEHEKGREVLWNSHFASMLKERSAEDSRQTDDAVFLKEELDGMFELRKTTLMTRNYINALLGEVLNNKS